MGTTVKPYNAGGKKEEVEQMFDNIAHSYDFLNHAFSFGIDILWRKRAIRILKKENPKLVYLTLSPHGAAFYKDGLLSLMLKIMGAKIVFHIHGKGIEERSRQSFVKKFLYILIFKNVDVIHLSESLFFDLLSVYDPAKQLVALPNSAIMPPNLNVEKNKEVMVFIFLSNLMRTKGADTLINAIKHISPELQCLFKVKIIGKESDNNYTNEIKNLLNTIKYDNVELLGPKYGNEKYVQLLSSDVFILPTKNECFPISVLEAISCGLPVISTKEGAIPDIIKDGEMGIILDECTPEALARAMVFFINNPLKIQEYGAECRNKFINHYTPDIFEKNFTLLIDAIISSNESKFRNRYNHHS
jgi:glycosyltransferase involved in cell wall biosynthesis